MTATTTIIGNLTADPELRFSQSGIAIASFTVASTEKVFDRQSNEWKDGKKLFMRCTAWREIGQHAANSLTKGTRVIVVGKIATNEFEDKEGNKRSNIELTVDSIGPDLKYATAQVARVQGESSRNQGQGASTGNEWATTAPANPAPSGDVWNTPASTSDEYTF